MFEIHSWDCDGVVFINKDVRGLRPEPNDVIITGRSFEEEPETRAMLAKRAINNPIFFNPLKYHEKSRQTAGEHKARTIKRLRSEGYNIVVHWEDDEVQAEVIRRECPEIHVIMIVHDLTYKENKRHYEF